MTLYLRDEHFETCQGPNGTELKEPIDMVCVREAQIIQSTICRFLDRVGPCLISQKEPKEKCPKFPGWTRN